MDKKTKQKEIEDKLNYIDSTIFKLGMLFEELIKELESKGSLKSDTAHDLTIQLYNAFKEDGDK